MSNMINVVKYDCDENLLVWKHPMDKMYESTDIVVQEGQEAIVFVNGHFVDLYKTGRFRIHTEEKKVPVAFMLTIGNLAMRQARAQ